RLCRNSVRFYFYQELLLLARFAHPHVNGVNLTRNLRPYIHIITGLQNTGRADQLVNVATGYFYRAQWNVCAPSILEVPPDTKGDRKQQQENHRPTGPSAR